jgi:hypothetical protein
MSTDTAQAPPLPMLVSEIATARAEGRWYARFRLCLETNRKLELIKWRIVC